MRLACKNDYTSECGLQMQLTIFKCKNTNLFFVYIIYTYILFVLFIPNQTAPAGGNAPLHYYATIRLPLNMPYHQQEHDAWNILMYEYRILNDALALLGLFTLTNMPSYACLSHGVVCAFTLPEVDCVLELAPQLTLPDPTHIGLFFVASLSKGVAALSLQQRQRSDINISSSNWRDSKIHKLLTTMGEMVMQSHLTKTMAWSKGKTQRNCPYKLLSG